MKSNVPFSTLSYSAEILISVSQNLSKDEYYIKDELKCLELKQSFLLLL